MREAMCFEFLRSYLELVRSSIDTMKKRDRERERERQRERERERERKKEIKRQKVRASVVLQPDRST